MLAVDCFTSRLLAVFNTELEYCLLTSYTGTAAVQLATKTVPVTWGQNLISVIPLQNWRWLED